MVAVLSITIWPSIHSLYILKQIMFIIFIKPGIDIGIALILIFMWKLCKHGYSGLLTLCVFFVFYAIM